MLMRKSEHVARDHAMPICGTPRDVVALAVELAGHKRGEAMAADARGVRPDTARKLLSGAASGRYLDGMRVQRARREMALAWLRKLDGQRARCLAVLEETRGAE